MAATWTQYDALPAVRRLRLAPRLSCLGTIDRRDHTSNRIFPRFSIQIVRRGHGRWLRADLAAEHPVAGPAVIAQRVGVHARYGPASGTTWDEFWFAYERDQWESLAALHLDALWQTPRYLADSVGLEPRIQAMLAAAARLGEIGGGDRLDSLGAEMIRFLLIEGAEHPFDRAVVDVRLVVADVAGYLEAHLTQPIDIPALVAQHGISLATFHRSWQRRFTRSPQRHLQHLRLQRACTLLENGASVAAAAQASGIGDPGYLARLFQRTFGCSPRDWRKREEAG